MSAAPLITAAGVAALLVARAEPGETMIVGLTGSVASGKSRLAADMARALQPGLRVEIVSTDGYLKPNSELAEQDLLWRKGFPESYDRAGLRAMLEAVRHGPASVRGYSHSLYDVDPALTRHIDRPDILLLEGLGFAPVEGDHGILHALDQLIYLDAGEEDLERWFLDRFMALWRAAADDTASFYHNFRHMSEAEARAFAELELWRAINLPNLHDHISRARALADLLLWKLPDHQLRLVRPELPGW